MAENTEASAIEEQVGNIGHALAYKADKIKYLLLALLVVLVAVAAIVSYTRKAAVRRDAEAKNTVYETLVGIQNNNSPLAGAADAFGQVARDFSGTNAGAQANLLQFAFTYNENKDYAAAEKVAEQFIKTYPRSVMIPRARYALGQAMLQQDKVDEAIAVFRPLVSSNNPEILPEAKLALAQALERRAEQAKDDPEEYQARLETAEAEYNDIITRSLISIPSQRGFWPQAVTLPADYALVQLKDKLAGHTHGTPSSMEPGASQDGVMSIPPPPAGAAEAAEALSRAIEAVRESAAETAEAGSEAAASAVQSGAEAVSESVSAATDTASDAADAVAEASVNAASTIDGATDQEEYVPASEASPVPADASGDAESN